MHLGHASSYVKFDVIHRLLRDYWGYDVHMGMLSCYHNRISCIGVLLWSYQDLNPVRPSSEVCIVLVATSFAL